MNRSTAAQSIVANGRGLWRKGVTAKIRAEVAVEFEGRLRTASMFGRVRLRLEIEREVARRLRDVRPPSDEALF